MNTTSGFQAYESKLETAPKLAAAILPYNKGVLFEALARAGIQSVTISFDGYGDSGQMEAPVAFDSDAQERALPPSTIVVKSVDFDAGKLSEKTITVREYIETLAYDLLEGVHEGWENNDGAYGEFQFSLAEQSISLEYHERYTETRDFEHEF